MQPGQSHTVPKNTKHAFYNADNKAITFKGVFAPALHFEYLAQEMVAAANRSYPHPPSSYEVAYILAQAKGEYYMADISRFKQNVIMPLQAKLGKLFGLVKNVKPLQSKSIL